MIFVSVGTQLPFDRMIRTMDGWAARTGFTDIVAQTGEGGYVPRSFTARPFIDAAEFNNLQQRASLLISHAGMGAILTAMGLGKPLIIVPRLFRLGEHRNDHQLATAQQFAGRPGIWVAYESEDLERLLDQRAELIGSTAISSSASPELITTLRGFLENPGAAAPATRKTDDNRNNKMDYRSADCPN